MVSATDGVFDNKVQVSWVDIAGETSYQVYRCSSFDVISCGDVFTTLPMDTTIYATEKAYDLVQSEGIPFRDAYLRVARSLSSEES